MGFSSKKKFKPDLCPARRQLMLPLLPDSSLFKTMTFPNNPNLTLIADSMMILKLVNTLLNDLSRIIQPCLLTQTSK